MKGAPWYLPGEQADRRHRILAVVDAMSDGLVVTTPDGQVLAANPAFIEFVRVRTEDQVRGRWLQDWLGRGSVDFDVLLTNLPERGSFRLHATTLKDDHGGAADVEISAVSVPDGEDRCIGVAVRNVGRRAPRAISEHLLPLSAQPFTELVGRVPMKEIVRNTTDLIEKVCIKAALRLTGDNRASAAELLGLSRQSLYVKLHRHGIGNLG